MSAKYTIERCRENYEKAIKRVANMVIVDRNDVDGKPFDFELGRSSSLYREQYHGGM